MLRPRPCSIATLLLCAATGSCANSCGRGVGPEVRSLEVRGLPRCPPRATYERPIVVRVDRERALFDEPFSTQMRVESPANFVSLSVPRARMRVTVRAGLCVPTSLGTWNCAAATWLATASVDLDSRATPAGVALPEFEAACKVGPR